MEYLGGIPRGRVLGVGYLYYIPGKHPTGMLSCY